MSEGPEQARDVVLTAYPTSIAWLSLGKLVTIYDLTVLAVRSEMQNQAALPAHLNVSPFLPHFLTHSIPFPLRTVHGTPSFPYSLQRAPYPQLHSLPALTFAHMLL